MQGNLPKIHVGIHVGIQGNLPKIHRESKGIPTQSKGIQGTEKELELLLILLAAALIDSKGDCTEDSQHHHLKITM